MHRFIDPANAITMTGLAAAAIGIALSAQGHLAWACVCLLVTGVCDLFDGFVARKLQRDEQGKTFGGRLDSLVDACGFGMAPVGLLVGAGLKAPHELVVVVLFSACTVWRLAYFDTVGLVVEPDGKRRFVGLPTTFSSLALPLAFLAGFAGRGPLKVAAAVTAVGLSICMVSPFKVPKPGGAWYGILTCVAIGLAVVYATQAAHYPAS